MITNKQYDVNDISIYVPKDSVVKPIKPFHIVVDEHDEYYVSLITKMGLTPINRSQLDPEELISVSYMWMLNKYNEICHNHGDFSILLHVKDSYTEQELIEADYGFNIIYSNVPSSMIKKSIELEKLNQKVKTK